MNLKVLNNARRNWSSRGSVIKSETLPEIIVNHECYSKMISRA